MKKAIIASLLTALLIGGAAWGFITRQNNITAASTSELDSLLDRIYAIDNLPPNNPEEVMDYLLDILTALNGNIVLEDGLMAGIIYRQRLLFGEDILALNSFDDQYAHFLSQLTERREADVYQTSISIEEIISLSDTSARVHLAQTFSQIGRVHWVYLLEKEAGEWKIHSWKTADNYFRVVE